MDRGQMRKIAFIHSLFQSEVSFSGSLKPIAT